MDSESELKACLKAAREAVAKKDFKDAMKHVTAALKIDSENYNVRKTIFIRFRLIQGHSAFRRR
jgi:hypothetical protein